MSIIKIPQEYLRDYIVSRTLPTISSFNSYIPIDALTNGELYINPEDNIKVLAYCLTTTLEYTVSNYGVLMNALIYGDEIGNSLVIRRTGITVATSTKLGSIDLRINDHLYLPLMRLCVKSQHLFNINRDNPNPKHFCLLIDRKFYNDLACFTVYRNVKKGYIDKIEEEGIDVLYTNDIIDLCYNTRGLSMPQFRTISEMINYTRSINQELHEALTEEAAERGIRITDAISDNF